MKINKIIYIFLIIIILFTLTSCKYKAKELNDEDFVILAAKVASGEEDGKIVDLRKTIDFENGHILSSLLFDINNKTIDEFNEWIKIYLNNVKTVLIIDDGKESYSKVLELLTNKKVYYYSLGYDTLKSTSYFDKYIIEKTGLDDCGC